METRKDIPNPTIALDAQGNVTRIWPVIDRQEMIDAGLHPWYGFDHAAVVAWLDRNGLWDIVAEYAVPEELERIAGDECADFGSSDRSIAIVDAGRDLILYGLEDVQGRIASGRRAMEWVLSNERGW